MTKIHKIVNAETGEVIENAYSKEEIKEYELNLKIEQKAKVEADAKEIAKSAILDRIGLTADELKTILG
jgi:hypothetical protein